MTTRERFQAVMGFAPFDRLPVMEWATWWDKTIARWKGEGLPRELIDGADIQRYFGLDVHLQDWIRPRTADCPGAKSHGAAIIATEEDYDRLRPHMFPWPCVDEEKWRNWAKLQEKGEAILWVTLEGFFWLPRTLMGIEEHMLGFYDQPKLMHRINADNAVWIGRVVDRICSICTPDFMTFAEDMSYNHGPMLSRELYEEFMAPYYAQVVPDMRRRGMRTIVDSDGDITTAWPWFEASGLDGILPLERQAGVDVAVLRKRHPKALFIGCFDKLTMHRGEAAMRAEFERLLPTAAQGGLIVSVDHQTPPGVSLEQYRLFLRLFREYAERAGRMSRGI